MKKRRYKVMSSFELEDCVKATKITPVFNRNGYYLDRQTGNTWLEIDGEAYAYGNKKEFIYRLQTAENERYLEPHVYKALGVILGAGLGSQKLWNKYLIELDRLSYKQVYRESRLTVTRILKEIRN